MSRSTPQIFPAPVSHFQSYPIFRHNKHSIFFGTSCYLCLMMSFLFFFFFPYRFLPLKFVELSVHSTDNHQLMLKLVNGRSYYLELCAPPDQQHCLFQHWLQLISLLKPQKNPSNTNINIRCKDSGTSHEEDPRPNNSSENVSLWQMDIKPSS